MKKLFTAMLGVAACSAFAATYYLTDDWTKNGENFCKYADGTVLNVGHKVCPSSITK